jgi:MurNAc alpha-1-phosphate uridylyltransferase
MLFPVAILAGGFARRLGTLTERVPKSLLQIAGRPFLDWQLEYLKLQGASRVLLCLGHHAEQVVNHVGDGGRYGLDIVTSYDGSIPLGTGGALVAALDKLGEHFFVLYGDSFLPINFSEVQQAFLTSKKLALMTVYMNHNKFDKSNVRFEGEVVVQYQKQNTSPDMTFIDYGLGVLSARLLETRTRGEPFDLAELYSNLAQRGLLGGFEIKERFYEIGSRVGIRETEDFLLGRMKA